MVGGVSGCRYAVGAEMVSAVSTVMFVTTILAEAGFVQVKSPGLRIVGWRFSVFWPSGGWCCCGCPLPTGVPDQGSCGAHLVPLHLRLEDAGGQAGPPLLGARGFRVCRCLPRCRSQPSCPGTLVGGSVARRWSRAVPPSARVVVECPRNGHGKKRLRLGYIGDDARGKMKRLLCRPLNHLKCFKRWEGDIRLPMRSWR